MDAISGDVAIRAWKEQLDAVLRVTEALTEGAMRLRDTQLTAATEAHASTAATRMLLEKTCDTQELYRLQSEWLSANLQQSLAYWAALYTTVIETQQRIARCVAPQAQAPEAQAPASQEPPRWPLQDMMDSFYRPFIETTMGLLASRPPSSPEERIAA